MKIAVWFNSASVPTEGGGHSYFQRLTRKIDLHEFEGDTSIVFLGEDTHGKFSSLIKNKAILFLPTVKSPKIFACKILKVLARKLKISFIETKIDVKLRALQNEVFTRFLESNEISLIVYLQPGTTKVDNFPSIITNWDIGHISSFAFPEFINDFSFEMREHWFWNNARKATKIIVESEAGKNELKAFFNVPDHKIHVVPIFAGSSIMEKMEHSKTMDKMKAWGLESNQYFFYPAQFWAHKNHYHLLLAFNKLVKSSSKSIKLVFTGSDKGNWEYIDKTITELSLTDLVINLGFVENEEMNALYTNAIALVMPTFLGPTNMPPLEALELNCPILCSDIPGHREMLKNGAIYFHPESSDQIYKAMSRMLDNSTRQELIDLAELVKNDTDFRFTIDNAIFSLEECIKSTLSIRSCWK